MTGTPSVLASASTHEGKDVALLEDEALRARLAAAPTHRYHGDYGRVLGACPQQTRIASEASP